MDKLSALQILQVEPDARIEFLRGLYPDGYGLQWENGEFLFYALGRQWKAWRAISDFISDECCKPEHWRLVRPSFDAKQKDAEAAAADAVKAYISDALKFSEAEANWHIGVAKAMEEAKRKAEIEVKEAAARRKAEIEAEDAEAKRKAETDARLASRDSLRQRFAEHAVHHTKAMGDAFEVDRWSSLEKLMLQMHNRTALMCSNLGARIRILEDAREQDLSRNK